ncbi:MAG: DnaJ domain-containing protein [Coxiellaceae bacterium]|nr:DnaJ domain-containing protein [Coxiellaceae bacterium]
MSRSDMPSALRDELIALAEGYLKGDGATPFFGTVARLPGVSYLTQRRDQWRRIELTNNFIATLRALGNPERDLFKVQNAINLVVDTATVEKRISPRLTAFIACCNAAVMRVQVEQAKREAVEPTLVVRARDIPLPPSRAPSPALSVSLPADPPPSGAEKSKRDAARDAVRDAARFALAKLKPDTVKPVVVDAAMFTSSGVADYKALNMYQRLGVPRNPSHKELHKAFQTLGNQITADKNKAWGPQYADAVFRDLLDAYRTLREPELRVQYDYSLAVGDTARAYAPVKTALDPEEFSSFGTQIQKAVQALVPKSTTGQLLATFGIGAAVAVAVVMGNRGGTAPRPGR